MALDAPLNQLIHLQSATTAQPATRLAATLVSLLSQDMLERTVSGAATFRIPQ